MMINVLIVLGIVAIGAWLGNILLAVEGKVAQIRNRVRSAKDRLGGMEAAIHRLRQEEQALVKDIEGLNDDTLALRRKQSEVLHRLAEEQARRRPRLLILNDRRDPGDREWIVTVVNQRIGEIDAAHPLAAEWAKGREYLVWAGGEREAAERANRRFGVRPGYQVRSVAAAGDELHSGPAARPAI